MADLSPIVVEIKMSGEVKDALDAMQRDLDALNARLEEALEELRRGEVILGAVEETIESAADVAANVLKGVGLTVSAIRIEEGEPFQELECEDCSQLCPEDDLEIDRDGIALCSTCVWNHK